MAAFMRGRKWGARKGLAPPPSPVQGRGFGAAFLEEPGVFSETVKLGVLLVTGPTVSNRMSTGSNLLIFPVLRIKNVYPGSDRFHPGSWIQSQKGTRSRYATKRIFYSEKLN
jgi:hypothetical protein